MNNFYKQAVILDNLIKLSEPTQADYQNLYGLINADEQLKIYFYKFNENPKWLNLLYQNDEFLSFLEDQQNIFESNLRKAEYLLSVTESFSDEVLDVIGKYPAKNPFVRGKILEILLKVESAKSIKFTWLILKYLYVSNEANWYYTGEKAAELMVRYSEDYLNESFAIAEKLLEIEKVQDRDRIESNFKSHIYKDLLLKFYSKLWDKDPFRAFVLLYNTLKNCLDQANGDESADTTHTLFMSKFEDIDDIEDETFYGRKIELILLKGLRDAGKNVLEKQYGKIDKFFTYIEKGHYKIFKLLGINFLRFVKSGDHEERIENTLFNQDYIYDSDFNNEYILLLRDKYTELKESDIKEKILKPLKEKIKTDSIEHYKWVKVNYPEKSESFDINKYQARQLANWLYKLKDSPLFKDIYNKNKQICGLSDNDLIPEPRISHAEFVDQKEGSAINFEEMVKMEPLAIIKKLKDRENWKDVSGKWWRDKEGEAISQVFEDVVKHRFDVYIAIKPNTILELDPIFVNRYINGLYNGFSENIERKNNSWLALLKFGQNLYETKGYNAEYDWAYRSILSILESTISQESLKADIANNHLDDFWSFTESLCRYDDKRDEKEDYNQDPHQRSINCVQGRAFELAIRFALVCKNTNQAEYGNSVSKKFKDVLQYALDNVYYKKVRCIFGVWFPQIHWLEEDWVFHNIDKIFTENNYDDWNVVWGSYLNWSRAYKPTFLYLREKGKYKFAIDHINEEDKYKRSKVPSKGVAEHLMIAFFNKWIDFSDPILKQFYSKANPDTKGKAVSFLSTGFKSMDKEEKPDKEIIERLKGFWKSRLAACQEDSSLKDEIVEFTGWVNDIPFENNETLNLLYETLELVDGKVGKMRDVMELVKGICKIAENNELLALKCLNKIEKDQEFVWSFSMYKESLESFLHRIVKLYGNKEVKAEAITLINSLGRLQIHNFKDLYNKLEKLE